MKVRNSIIGAVLALGLAASLTAETDLDKIKAAGVIRIGTEGTYSPFAYHEASGKIVGFDVEIGQEIAKRLGVKAEFIDAQWDGLIAGLDAKRWDAVINEVTITEARKAKYDFSDPYVVTKPALIVRTDSTIASFADLKGKKAVENLGTTYAKIAEESGAAIVDASLPLEVVLTGRADATINDRLFFLDYKKRQPNAALKIVAVYDKPDYQGIVVRKGNPELVAAINKILGEIKADGTYQKISLKYFGEDVSK